MNRHLEVVGAGPAGLAAALTARAADASVTVYEKHLRAGERFHGDFQGLENWTTEEDTLSELERLGMPLEFQPTPIREIVCFDAQGIAYPLRSPDRAIFYLIKRGSADDTFDTALARLALKAGATLRWGTHLEHLRHAGVIAEGPHEADVIATGYTFTTNMADGWYAAVSDALAPDGYAYLLVHDGVGTVAACLYRDFHNEKQYRERTVDFFTRHVALRWSEARPFGGAGNVLADTVLRSGSFFYAGESAGLQDPLFGFGLRYALLSGHFAAQACLAGSSQLYERLLRSRLRDFIRTGLLNRRLYNLLRDSGRQWFVRHVVARADPRNVLARLYRPSRIKVAVGSIGGRHRPSHATKPGCDCTWCRCRANGCG